MPEDADVYRDAARDADDHPKGECHALLPVLEEQIKAADYNKTAEVSNAAEVFEEIAQKYDAAGDVLDVIRSEAGSVAQRVGNNPSKDELISILAPRVEELQREQEEEEIEEKLSEGVEYTLDGDGIGVDEYVEEHLTGVVRIGTVDRTSDTSMVFEFDDGTSVEFEDTRQRSEPIFYQQISAEAPEHVVEKIASKQAMDDIKGDVTQDEWAAEKYAKLSHGPETRPWGHDWKEVIADLEAKFEMERTPVTGPNTDAWEHIKHIIGDVDASKDKQSVIDSNQDAVHYSEKYDEVWVPKPIIATACEKYATEPESLVHELSARGVDSDNISGVGCSYGDSTVNPTTRFWRFDCEHDDVPEPHVVDEIDTEKTVFATGPETGNMDVSGEGDN